MAKDVSLFSSLSEAKEKNIFVANDFALIVASSDRVDCENGVITDNYRPPPNLRENLLIVPQLT